MKLSKQSGRGILRMTILVAFALLGGVGKARSQDYRVIYDFGQGSDGWHPVGVPAVTKNGDLLGVTNAGGPYNLGTVYKLSAPKTRGGTWTETILYDFPGGNGGGTPFFYSLVRMAICTAPVAKPFLN